MTILRRKVTLFLVLNAQQSSLLLLLASIANPIWGSVPNPKHYRSLPYLDEAGKLVAQEISAEQVCSRYADRPGKYSAVDNDFKSLGKPMKLLQVTCAAGSIKKLDYYYTGNTVRSTIVFYQNEISYESFYSNGSRRSSGKLVASFKYSNPYFQMEDMGSREGKWEFFYPEGTLQGQFQYVNGKPMGLQKWFTKDGVPCLERSYGRGGVLQSERRLKEPITRSGSGFLVFLEGTGCPPLPVKTPIEMQK